MGGSLELPAFCGPINFDMNRDWPCKRLSLVYAVHRDAKEITRERGRLGRMRSAYRRRHLTEWIADAEQRLSRLAGWAAAQECTCPAPASYATLSDVPLPECTCGS